jgi:hypothetical protein
VTAFILGRSFLMKQQQQELDQVQKANEQRHAELARTAK